MRNHQNSIAMPAWQAHLNYLSSGFFCNCSRKSTCWRYIYLGIVFTLFPFQVIAETEAPIKEYACGGQFEATVRDGPSKGLTLKGELVIWTEKSGHAKGLLTLADNKVILASGQVNGQAINLIFSVAPDTFIFGVGTAQFDFQQCAGLWGGPFVGPKEGDRGDWLATNIKSRR